MVEFNLDSDYWDKRYSDGSTGWDRGGVHPALVDWISDELKTPCSIAVPGCGIGYEVELLATKGYSVVGIDFAAEPVQSLRKRLGGYESNVDILQTDIFEFSRIHGQCFDAVYEQTCLCAMRPEQRTAYEEQLFNWLTVGGKLYILFMQTENTQDEPPFHCSIEEMKKVFRDERWMWSIVPLRRYDHPNGKDYELATVLKRRVFRFTD